MAKRGSGTAQEQWSAATKQSAMEQVLALMAEGRTVKEATEQLKLGVSPGTVRRWMAGDDAMMARYQQAKKLLAYALAEEAITVARESTNHSSASDRVLIDTLKWAAAKANPAEFGERQTVEHQGAQTLSVRVVEEDAPKTVRQAIESAVLAQTPVMLPALKSPD